MPSLRERLHTIIFEAETRAGKLFDVALLIAILASVLAVSLETVPSITQETRQILRAVEWAFTGLFTVEYALRLYSVERPLRYATSFFGVIDLVAILPAYLSLVLATSHSLATIRIMRLVRVFRVLKLARFLGEASVLRAAIRSSLPKITVFLLTVLCVVVVIGTTMYVIEGKDHGFVSIPVSTYWAIVTLTTVGYGDIAPQTTVGQVLASMVMILGYAVIAVPTGIVSAELVRRPKKVTTVACESCGADGHAPEAKFCYKCAAEL